MKKLSRKQVHDILKSNMGWGDAKRKLCDLLGVEYHWNFSLPDYVKDHIKSFYFPKRRSVFK